MKKALWLLSSGLIAFTPPALAQTAEEAAAERAATPDQGDIIVTATRRSQALSDVPLAVSAITADTLQNSGASDIRQLNQVSPSLLVSSTSSEAGAGVARIRGVGTVGDNAGLESSVAVFIDGVYRNRSGVGLTELGAIDRIEVLRGPQGTLFGRNASAGLIHVITAKPKFEHEGTAELSYGNYDYWRGVLGLTGPITETLAFRLDGVYTKRDGFLKDVVSGRDLNNRDRWLARGQLLYEPSDELSVRLIGDYSSRNEECCAGMYLPGRNVSRAPDGSLVFSPSSIAGLQRALGATINEDTYSRRTAITPGRSYRGDVKDWGLSGEINYDLGGAQITSITAYRDWKYKRGQDADFNNLDILVRDDDGSANQRFQTFTQELRLQGEAFDGKLDWLVGGYFANEKLTLNDNLSYGSDYQRYANCLLAANVGGSVGRPDLLSVAGTNCFNPAVGGALASNPAIPAANRQVIALLSGLAPGVPVGGYNAVAAALGMPGFTFNGVGIRDHYEQTSRNFAFFTHNVFNVTDKLSVTVGARYTNERKSLDASFADNNSLCRAISVSPLSALQQLACVNPSVPGGVFAQDDAKTKEDKFTYTGVLSYKPIDDLLIYASYSKGYKAGGFNLDRNGLNRNGRVLYTDGSTLINGTGAIGAGNAGAPNLLQLTFEPEGVHATEIGAKYNGRGFDLNVSAFYQVFDNFQLNTFNGVNFVVENINACGADLGGAPTDNDSTTGACTGKVKGGVVSKGVEVEAYMTLAPNVHVVQGFTYADTQYRKNLVGKGGRPLSAAFFQLPGSRVSNSALYTFTGSLAWTPDIGSSGLGALFYVDYRYQSGLNTGSDLDIEKRQQGVMVVNARVGLTGGEGRWGIEFWGQNIFNVNYKQVAFDTPLQGTGTTAQTAAFGVPSTQLFSTFVAEPRAYGVTVRTKF
ncbi:TonB-dependent receptor [Sphingomonas sp. KC8]|uniref:TonB-dependent receptor n=1 Tax=Sphingomonas sp. KC8 TaxID=1030157 RepID=UPI0002489B65|nr:TonB-dependent receptor [Sphingomonas sp. KC8]ARS28039.1 TonB-dependent receptor [Sphingomonas sp. KC8]